MFLPENAKIDRELAYLLLKDKYFNRPKVVKKKSFWQWFFEDEDVEVKQAQEELDADKDCAYEIAQRKGIAWFNHAFVHAVRKNPHRFSCTGDFFYTLNFDSLALGWTNDWSFTKCKIDCSLSTTVLIYVVKRARPNVSTTFIPDSIDEALFHLEEILFKGGALVENKDRRGNITYYLKHDACSTENIIDIDEIVFYNLVHRLGQSASKYLASFDEAGFEKWHYYRTVYFVDPFEGESLHKCTTKGVGVRLHHTDMLPTGIFS